MIGQLNNTQDLQYIYVFFLVAFLLGFMVGKGSYLRVLNERLAALENSPMGERIREHMAQRGEYV